MALLTICCLASLHILKFDIVTSQATGSVNSRDDSPPHCTTFWIVANASKLQAPSP